MSATIAKQHLKSKTLTRRKPKSAVKNDSWKSKSLIRPWARQSALAIFRALSDKTVTAIPRLAKK